MKYASFNFEEKETKRGGDYWKDVDFAEHLKLTSGQSTYRYLRKNYPQPLSILEAGCGIGRWVIPLAKEGYSVTGIEIEEEAVRKLKSEFSSSNLNLVVGDVFCMCFPNASFDIVLSLGVLEHFENPEIQKSAILEHVRVLKDDGVFLVTVPLLSAMRFFIHIPVQWLISALCFFVGKKTFFTEYRYSKKEFERILKDCGLDVIDIVYDEFLPPHSMGLTVGVPFKILFLSPKGNFLLNTFGRVVAWLCSLTPSISSGGIGYICKKQNRA